MFSLIGVLCTGIFLAIAGSVLGFKVLKHLDMRQPYNNVAIIVLNILAFVIGGYLMQQYQFSSIVIIRNWILLYGLNILCLIDYQKRIIPNRALMILLAARTLCLIVEVFLLPEHLEILISSLIGLVGGAALFLFAGIICKSSIGMGDVKLVAVTGYFLGFQVLMSTLIITMLLTLIAGIIVLIKAKQGLKTTLPFAPFMMAGTLTAVLLGF